MAFIPEPLGTSYWALPIKSHHMSPPVWALNSTLLMSSVPEAVAGTHWDCPEFNETNAKHVAVNDKGIKRFITIELIGLSIQCRGCLLLMVPKINEWAVISGEWRLNYLLRVTGGFSK
jgi:hypothetical protein